MKKTNRTWLKAAAATVGAGALTLGGVALPALAVDESPEEATTFNVEADKYEVAGATLDVSADEAEQLEEAEKIDVLDGGIVVHRDTALSEKDLSGAIAGHAHDHGDGEDEGAETFSADETPVDAGAPIPGTPTEGSKPGAPVTIYLDFDGAEISGKSWNDRYTDGADLSLDGASAAANAAWVEHVWAAVAEDWAPFDINVTTVDPGEDALYKTSLDDTEYGAHVVITDSYPDFGAGTSGLAPLGGAGSDYLTPALVFVEGTLAEGNTAANANPRSVADTATHEAGHLFGLSHDGFGDEEYYMPLGGVWSPIMGAGYTTPLSQWSNGDYNGSTTTEDDIALISGEPADPYYFLGFTRQDGTPYDGGACEREGNGDSEVQPGEVFFVPNAENLCDPAGEDLVNVFTYTDRAAVSADEVGDTPADATALDNASGTFETTGIIETREDVDAFKFTTVGGPVSAQVDVAQYGPNLDASLELVDSEGTVIASDDPASSAPTDNPQDAQASSDPANGLGASVSAEVETGTYYLLVEGVGNGDGSGATADDAGGYSDYGSLGNYTLSGSAAPFVTEEIVITAPEDGTEVEGGSDVEVTGTATANATVTVTASGSDAEVTVTADENGNWSAVFPANAYGETAITATQTVLGTEAGSDSVTVVSPVPAPVIETPAEGDVTDETPTISGTSVPGATVVVSVENAAGDIVEVTVTADAEGTWSASLSDALAAGDYTVTAVATVNGVTSEADGPVAFTVEAAEDTDDSTDGTDGTTDGTTDDSTDGTDGTTDGTDGTADDTDADDTDATDGATDGNDDGSTDDSLAVTGSDFNAAPLGFIALGLLVVGAGTAVFAIRQRKLSMKG